MKIVKTILRLEKYISKPKQLAKKISNWLSTSRKANWPKPDSKYDLNFSQVCSHDLKAYKLFPKFILDSFMIEISFEHHLVARNNFQGDNYLFEIHIFMLK